MTTSHATRHCCSRTLVVGLVLSFGACLPDSAFGIVFDAVDDFTTATNTEASNWSYRFANDEVRDGAYSLFTTTGVLVHFPGAEFWLTPSANFAIPLIGANRTGGPLTSGGVTFPQDTLFAHPGNGGLVVLSWLSPATFQADIAFQISDADPFGGDGIAWFLERNSAADTLASGALDNGGGTVPMLISDVAVQSGDRLNLVIGDRGGFANDTTVLTMTITAVPEPASLVQLSIGVLFVLGCGATRRRLRPFRSQRLSRSAQRLSSTCY